VPFLNGIAYFRKTIDLQTSQEYDAATQALLLVRPGTPAFSAEPLCPLLVISSPWWFSNRILALISEVETVFV
jgi:hypothetical protein